MIKWKVDCEIEIMEDAAGDQTTVESRKVGQIDDAEIFGYATTWDGKNKYPQLQFADGSITMGVDADWFEIVEG